MTENKKQQMERLEQMRYINKHKYESNILSKKEVDDSIDNRFVMYQQKFNNSERQIVENQRKLRLEKLKRDEVWHLRRIDQQDNLEEMKLKRQREKNQVIQKHQMIGQQFESQKEEMKMWQEKVRQDEQARRTFMSNKKMPYEEMKCKFLSQAAVTPDITKFRKEKNGKQDLNQSALI